MDVNRAFDRGNQVDIFYGDFKNAFDKVCHQQLVEKMAGFGFGAKTIIGYVSSLQIEWVL